jgi:hypothetical protein
MDAHLRAGVAVYNAEEYHAAHDAWEEFWLDLPAGTDDEQFLHGLIQFTAAVHHAQGGNWIGMQGLADSASDYLVGLPADYKGVNVGPVREYLARVAADPEHVERTAPPRLTYEGVALVPEDLDFEGAAIAADVIAEEYPGYDDGVIEQAAAYAREDLEAGDEGSKFITLVMDFARDEANRGIIYQRLEQHVQKRRAREEDVEGLFD